MFFSILNSGNLFYNQCEEYSRPAVGNYPCETCCCEDAVTGPAHVEAAYREIQE